MPSYAPPDLFRGFVPRIHVFFCGNENVDGRNESGHDDNEKDGHNDIQCPLVNLF